MEEDIKVVEGLCRCFRYEQSKLDELDRDNYADFIQEDEIKAIENLIARNKELEKMNEKVIEMLQEHIKHCEQEAKGSLNNEICNIALNFDKHLLQELLQEGDK